ncbi:hypothetical protein IWX49DRAFT_255256 [Phyllosticta citricarpa]|uniref:Uncharacterized protein n=1 Tax=Phyllosticta citricarpa TaxID=55181 RepID=A0ABR1LQD1_9PEZI
MPGFWTKTFPIASNTFRSPSKTCAQIEVPGLHVMVLLLRIPRASSLPLASLAPFLLWPRAFSASREKILIIFSSMSYGFLVELKCSPRTYLLPGQVNQTKLASRDKCLLKALKSVLDHRIHLFTLGASGFVRLYHACPFLSHRHATPSRKMPPKQLVFQTQSSRPESDRQLERKNLDFRSPF